MNEAEKARRLAIAYHESGHAIAGRALGATLGKITLEGVHTYNLPDGTRENAIMSLAGQEAVRIFGEEDKSKDWYRILPGLSGLDRGGVNAYTYRLYGRSRDALTNRFNRYQRYRVTQELQQEARKILLSDWVNVIKVASALRDRGSLTGQQLEKVLRGDSMLTDKAKPEPVTSGSPVAESRSLTREDRSRLMGNIEAIRRHLKRNPQGAIKKELEDSLARNEAQLAGRPYAPSTRSYRAYGQDRQLLTEEQIPEKRII